MLPEPRSARGPRRWNRWVLNAHVWIGMIATTVVLSVSVTGVLLNHKRELGLMPYVEPPPTTPLSDAVSLDALALIALAAVPTDGRIGWTAGGPIDLTLFDRLDVRPRDGLAKVRFRDRYNTEVTLELSSGQVLHVGERNDVFLEKLHTGEIFGPGFTLLSDAGALALVVALLTGYWLWLVPRLPRSRPQA